jgi:hypothetical protein
MPSLHCERCGLRVQFREAMLWMENCPRCEARSKTLSPLVVSPPVRWSSAPTEQSRDRGTREAVL